MPPSDGPPTTLTALLARRAAEQANDTAYVFLADGDHEAGRLTYGELAARASAVASELLDQVGTGQRALLVYPPGLEFLEAFFGCLLAGVIAVPLAPPGPREGLTRIEAVARDAGATWLLTTRVSLANMARRLAGAPALRTLTTDATARVPTSPPSADVRPDDLALLQYTSGSTGSPKGVMLSHANVVANEHMIAEGFGHDARSVVVGWLPAFHDMGLIGNLLQPLHVGATSIFMSPLAFLQRPARWLQAISRYRATTSGGPSFAYDLCVAKIADHQMEGVDLGSWDLAFNGSEPVRAATMSAFSARFRPWGFRDTAFYPCYGLAEATLLVTGGDKGSGARMDGDRVSCGRPRGDTEVEIVDPDRRQRCATGEVGEIWIRGPAVARGYWGRDALSHETFGATLDTAGRSPFLRTGDLGCMRGGELFVTGRLKDLIILRGRKHYPQDLELTAERSHPDLRGGAGAAFALEADGAAPTLVIVQEVRRDRLRSLVAEEIIGNVRAHIANEHGVRADVVVLLKQGGLLKTSSGKVRRSACREAFASGGLAPASVAMSGGRLPAMLMRSPLDDEGNPPR